MLLDYRRKIVQNQHKTVTSKGVRKGGGLGLKPPLELNILRKLYYLRKGD